MKITNGKIVTIGNALVDVITNVEPEFLKEKKLTPGSMTLMDIKQTSAIYDCIGSAHEVSGGSAANTAAIAAALGGHVSFIGKVADDQLGEIFQHDMRALNILMACDPLDKNIVQTGRCLSLVTPGGQRTMCTSLGAAQKLNSDDLFCGQIETADITFLEGYLLDSPDGYNLFHDTFENAGGRIALTLSDPGCVERHLEFLLQIIDRFDILFGNAEELAALYGSRTPERSVEDAAYDVDMVICTDGPNGVYLSNYGITTHLPAQKVEVVDTTGAGDSFAGTCLWALSAGHSLEDAARMSLIVAAEIISSIGARPMCNLGDLLKSAGFSTSKPELQNA